MSYFLVRMLRLTTLLAVIVLFVSGTAFAEFECQVDVSYRWRREAQKPAGITTPLASPAADATPSAEHALGTDIESVFWTSVKGNGAKEDEVKKKVENFANKEKSAAVSSCRVSHENLSGCISAKFSSVAPTLNNLGFAARKSLEEAISSDCQKQQGQCIDAISGEMKCAEIVAAVPAADEKEGKKEEAGGKGKKK